MRNPKVSLVVPVYNTEKLIDECIDSIVKQTYKNIEIIVVDDCSPDEAIKKVKIWQKKDSRIKIVKHAQNKGLPAARNTGLRNVTGDYIRHVDSDDVIAHNSTERLINYALKFDSDVICGNADRLTSDGVKKEAWLARHMERKENIKFEDDENLWPHLGSIYLFLFKSNFIFNNELFLNESITYGEDQIYVSGVLPLASSITYCPAITYFYRDNIGSMTYGITKKKAIDELSWPCLVRKNLEQYPVAYFHTLLRSSKHRIKVLHDVVGCYDKDTAVECIELAKGCYAGYTPADLFSQEALKLYKYFVSDTLYKVILIMSEDAEAIYKVFKDGRVESAIEEVNRLDIMQ